jgi:peroxiredoxin
LKNNIEKLKKILITLLVFILGVFLIYLVASQFFKTIEPKEITLEGEETIEGVKKIDYLAPDFELSNIKEEKIKLSDYENKIIILTFWTTWNPIAQDQLVILESYYQEIIDSKDIVLLTINNQEDKSVVTNFIRRGEYVLPILLDQEGEVGELYKITTLPATFFINKKRMVKEIYIGVLNKQEIKNKVENLYIE